MTTVLKVEAEIIAEKISKNDIWDVNDCKALCDLAGLSDKWEAADGETFEQVVYEAADVLGVEVV